jgi:hypothetical protein
LGGRLADRRDPTLLLGPVLLVGAILAVLSPALVYVVGPSAGGESAVAIVVLAAIGFFVPAAVLSTVTPIAAKVSLQSLDATGEVVGRLSAIGTAGALFGTFITGFFLIAAIPSQPITWVVGFVLLAFGLVLSLPMGRATLIAGVLLFALSTAGSAALAAPCDRETAYSCAIITSRSGEGPTVRALILDTFVNSVVDTVDPTYLSSRYTKVIDAVVSAQAPSGPIDVVYVGGGGYTLPRFYEATRGATATVLELDGELPVIAEDELGLERGPWLTTDIGDARLGIRHYDDASFDVAIADAFSGRSVPWHLTTVEFIADVRSTLRPDGAYVMNVIDHPPLAFVRAELATVAELFPHVAVIAPPVYLAGERGGNFVLVGSPVPIDAATIESRVPGEEVVLVDDVARAWLGDASVLTDDFAPADQLLSRP